MYTTISDPSDGWSNHWSNGEHQELKWISDRKKIIRKRKLRLYSEFNINNQKSKR